MDQDKICTVVKKGVDNDRVMTCAMYKAFQVEMWGVIVIHMDIAILLLRGRGTVHNMLLVVQHGGNDITFERW
jgi:hypothetical protein